MKSTHPEYRDSSPRGVGARKDCSPPTIYKEIREGRLKAKKIGKRTVITPEAEQDWINNLPDFEV